MEGQNTTRSQVYSHLSPSRSDYCIWSSRPSHLVSALGLWMSGMWEGAPKGPHFSMAGAWIYCLAVHLQSSVGSQPPLAICTWAFTLIKAFLFPEHFVFPVLEYL